MFDGRIFISGMPRADRERAWLQNLRADPRLTFHLKNGPVADLPATARVIEDPAERHEVLAKIARVWRRDPVEMEAHSPLIEVTIDGSEVGPGGLTNWPGPAIGHRASGGEPRARANRAGPSVRMAVE